MAMSDSGSACLTSFASAEILKLTARKRASQAGSFSESGGNQQEKCHGSVRNKNAPPDCGGASRNCKSRSVLLLGGAGRRRGGRAGRRRGGRAGGRRSRRRRHGSARGFGRRGRRHGRGRGARAGGVGG